MTWFVENLFPVDFSAVRLGKKKKRHFSGSVACWGTRGEGPWMCQNTLWKFQRAESLGNLLFLWKNVTGEMGDWHHKGPKIARAATHCQTRFRLRRWLLFCEVSGPEKKIGGVEIANYFFLLDMHRSRSKPHEWVSRTEEFPTFTWRLVFPESRVLSLLPYTTKASYT